MNTQATFDSPGILIVDDEAPLREIFSELLRECRHRVLTAANTAEAHCILQTETVDVVVCDQDMPGEDGLTFLTGLRKTHPTLQRILMTGQLSETLALRGINEAQLLRYIQKPCPPQELMEAVAEAVKIAKQEALRASPQADCKNTGRKGMVNRTESSIFQLVITGIIGLLALMITFIILFGLLYLFKCLLGIDLFPEIHLWDVL